jgi:hypothetical protein
MKKRIPKNESIKLPVFDLLVIYFTLRNKGIIYALKPNAA